MRTIFFVNLKNIKLIKIVLKNIAKVTGKQNLRRKLAQTNK